jgi:hypothetical protein
MVAAQPNGYAPEEGYRWEWKHGARVRVSAVAAAEEFRQIEEADRYVTRSTVLERASDPSSALHPEFEWDDAVAAHEHRLEHASYLIRSLVTVEVVDEQPRARRAYFNVRETITVLTDDDDGEEEEDTNREGIFVSADVAFSDPDMRREVLLRAGREMRAFIHRHRDLVELAGVFDAIEEAWDEETFGPFGE